MLEVPQMRVRLTFNNYFVNFNRMLISENVGKAKIITGLYPVYYWSLGTGGALL